MKFKALDIALIIAIIMVLVGVFINSAAGSQQRSEKQLSIRAGTETAITSHTTDMYCYTGRINK